MSASRELRRDLRRMGYAEAAIDAVWPEWWASEAEQSLSATTELRYTVARRLGLSPHSLFERQPRFIWRDQTRYKNLGTQEPTELGPLSAFGAAVARKLVAARPAGTRIVLRDPSVLREVILETSTYVDLRHLLVACWGVGIPVAYLTIFPLPQKRMHAMSVRVLEQHVVLLGRRTTFESQLAYTLAHEMGHVALGHLHDDKVLLEVEDPMTLVERDEEEAAADRYALELLTGSPSPTVVATESNFNAAQVAEASMRHATEYRVEPGVLALCLGYATGRWQQVFAALNMIPPGKQDLVRAVNAVATDQLSWSSLSPGNATYLRRVLGVDT